MNIKLITGSCICAATKIEAELRLINGAIVEVEESVLSANENGMTPVEPMRLEVDDAIYEGYVEIRGWIEDNHHLRVAKRHTEVLQEFRQSVPAYA